MFCRTERLLLRPGWIEDASLLSRTWNDQTIARNLPDLPVSTDENAAAEFLTQEREPLLPYTLLFARTGGAPRLVGGCGFSRLGKGNPDLGFWIARPYWGLGFATEAAGAMIQAARAAGFSHITARPSTDNKAAAHVLTKLGFRPTGRIEKRHSAARGGAIACALFEDSGVAPMRSDSALHLYMDRAPIAA